MKKLISLVLCMFIAFAAVACDGGGNNLNVSADGKLYINIPEGFGGGVGTQGIEAIAKKFNESPDFGSNPSRYKGYNGAIVKVVDGDTPSAGTLETKAVDFVFYDHRGLGKESAQNYMYDVTDLLNEPAYGETDPIVNKIPEGYRDNFKGYDGRYYSVPYGDIICGWIMNTEMFESDQLYISAAKVDGDPNWTAEDDLYVEGKHSFHSSKFGITLYFSNYDGDGEHMLAVRQTNGKSQKSREDLSAGPDGVKGTYDDGMVSSVIEFLALCDYIESGAIALDTDESKGRNPYGKKNFYSACSLSGAHMDGYIGIFTDAMFAALAGEDYLSTHSLNTQGDNTITVVTGWTNEKLYPGIDYIKKPKTAEVKVTPETGYYTTWMIEKFYADMIVEVLYREKYYQYGHDFASCHVDTEASFLIGGYRDEQEFESSAWYFDGNYASNEMRMNGDYDYIYENYDGHEERRIEFAPMPTSLDVPVTEENGMGDQPTLVVLGQSCMAINRKRVTEDPEGRGKAIIDFFKFFLSDVMLAEEFYWTNTMNSMITDPRVIAEDNPSSGLATHPNRNYYSDKIVDLMSDARKVHYVVNEVLQGSGRYYQKGYASGMFFIDTKSPYAFIREKIKSGTSNAAILAFEGQMYTKTGWDKIYSGYNTVPDANKVYTIDGSPVQYTTVGGVTA